ncbi:an1-type zinc finger 1 [Pyrrhoderma noxium]|uniref:An1-type zinc finger 1 n=1 Tax=Pyrrhoderma noxium TaxID=2282107 RepID=A0A286UV41_9AGAM|nr:an1-type zinc finger 1 [Pyrrhoderma noxium]
MDPPEFGLGCQFPSCGLVDFLPVKCTTCCKSFCKDHYSVDAHSCLEKVDNNVSTTYEKAPRCTFIGCTHKEPEGVPKEIPSESEKAAVTCPQCLQLFCIKHRFPSSHNCLSQKQEDMNSLKNIEAKALLSKNFPERYSKTKAVPDSSSKSQTQPKSEKSKKVQMMKIRQSAVPGDPKDAKSSVSITERIHIQVIFDESTSPKVFWFRKTISAGRAFDLLQSQCKASSRHKWAISKYSEEQDQEIYLAFDKLLIEQVEEGSIIHLKKLQTE